MKDDEKQFLIDVYENCVLSGETEVIFGILMECRTTPRDLINSDKININYKRAWYLLEKWCSKGLYEYGVTLDLGWLTDKGKEMAESLSL